MNLLKAIATLKTDGGYIKRSPINFPLLAFSATQNTASKKDILCFIHVIGHGELLKSNDAHCLSVDDYIAEDWVHVKEITPDAPASASHVTIVK